MAGYQRTEYGSKTGSAGDDKLQSSGSLEMIKAGPPSTSSGPTGSSRSYPKSNNVSLSADFNPMKVPASTYGVNGI
jgi:hypothetical protein